ncbi:hypothetical protein CCHR01_19392 [Colletotrichum chrysophilum]|uniref:Uncharacterized protein n=1 Tax=Colletotrichum chrysophilum TaxID=1836956 RepID=A0AAD8ZYK0_9PEZI|nr:hypothetical protein CCHR01_19392 [Colletotrichum chrysophilum]
MGPAQGRQRETARVRTADVQVPIQQEKWKVQQTRCREGRKEGVGGHLPADWTDRQAGRQTDTDTDTDSTPRSSSSRRQETARRLDGTPLGQGGTDRRHRDRTGSDGRGRDFTSSQATEYLSTDTSLRYRHRPSLWPAKPTSTARPVANPVPPSPGPKTPSTPCFRPTGSNSDKPAPNLDEYSEYNTQAAKPRLEAALRRKPLGFFFQWNPQRQSQYQRHKKCCVLRARRYQRRFSSPLYYVNLRGHHRAVEDLYKDSTSTVQSTSDGPPTPRRVYRVGGGGGGGTATSHVLLVDGGTFLILLLLEITLTSIMHIPAALISIPMKRLNINPPSRPLPESSSHGPQKGSRNPPARNALTRDTSYPSPIPSRTHLNINDLHSAPSEAGPLRPLRSWKLPPA